MPAKKLLNYPSILIQILYNIVIYPILISYLKEKYSDYKRSPQKSPE
jgi:hypothetical protein